MQLWYGKSQQFVADTTQNKIASMLSDAFFRHYHYKPSDNEVNSWRNSLRATALVFQSAKLDDHGILLEYQLPLSSRRLDCMVCGSDKSGDDQAVVVELKQWDKCEDTIGEHLVSTWVGGAQRDVLHPSAQVSQYRQYLEDTHTAFHEGPSPIHLSSCAYLHNYPHDKGDTLFLPRFDSLLRDSPTFTMDDAGELQEFLHERLSRGRGMAVLDRVRNSQYRPSKKLMEHVANVIDGHGDYVLLDEQLVVFDKVMALAKTGLNSRKRMVLVIKGGPGTGKSVIALNLMSRLLHEELNAVYATGSKAFTETLRANIGKRGAVQFKYFNSFMETAPDEIDVLICDEAHRLRNKSGMMFKPNKSGKLQIEEIIDVAKLPVFFVDDKQLVRPDEVGSIDYIKSKAVEHGCLVKEFELEAQFRCAGSDAYVNWVTNTLGVARTANAIWEGDERFDFRIFPSAESLEEAIRYRAAQGASARLTAGFCWEWSETGPAGTLIDDVVVGNWRKPWNARHDATGLAPGIPKAHLWAHSPGGIEQVGCVYTAQGFEFDYVGVIFGEDLRYDLDQQTWIGDPSHSHDKPVKRSKQKFLDLVKNTYRVLLSRGLKGCYVYFMDKDTERFIRTRIDGNAADPRLDEFRAKPQIIEVVANEPFRRLSREEVRPFDNCVPLYPLEVAAGAFSEEQQTSGAALGFEDRDPDAFEWVELPDEYRHKRGMFVTKVVGESMNRRIPNGSWCLFRKIAAGTRQGKVVLAQHRDISDTDTGGHYTVKTYESRKVAASEGGWQHQEILLKPDSTDDHYRPITINHGQQEQLHIVAELVGVLL